MYKYITYMSSILQKLTDFELCSERNIQALGFLPLNTQGQWRGSPLCLSAQEQ